MEGDVITMQDLFTYRFKDITSGHSLVGGLQPTGLRPTFLGKLERHGVPLPRLHAAGRGRRGRAACSGSRGSARDEAPRRSPPSRSRSRRPGAPPALPAPPSGLGLAEARSPGFPDRAYVLTLPDAQTLPEAELSVTENGQPVDDLKVERRRRASPPSCSRSTRARACARRIGDAMAAARAFADAAHAGPAARGRLLQPRAARRARADDRRRRDRPGAGGSARAARAAPGCTTPPPSGVEMIERAGVAAGSVIVLSDGADDGSVVGPQRARRRRRAGARPDLRRRAALAELRPDGRCRRSSTNGGQLRRGGRAGGPRRHLLAARRAAGTRVPRLVPLAPAARGRRRRRLQRGRRPRHRHRRVPDAGLPGPTGAARTRRRPGWESGAAATSAVLAIGLLLALGLGMLLRPLRASISRRISTVHRRAPRRPSRRTRPRRSASSSTPRTGGCRSGARGSSSSSTSSWRSSSGRRAGSSWRRRRRDARRARPARLSGSPLLAASRSSASRSRRGWSSATARRRRGGGSRTSCRTTSRCMASALRAGHSFVAALSVMVKDAPEPSRKEFRRVVQDEQLGVPVEQSLEVVHERMRCEDVDLRRPHRDAPARDGRQHRRGPRQGRRDDARARQAAPSRAHAHRAGPPRRLDRDGAADRDDRLPAPSSSRATWSR